MADLIAQGSESQQRWRRALHANQPFVIGRDAGIYSTPWDQQISRRHVTARWSEGRLQVEKCAEARNPVFHGGQPHDAFSVGPGEHFVIGQTTFTVVSDTVKWLAELHRPVEEQTFSSEALERVRFHNADQRIEVLSRLPDIISGAVNETELFVRLVSMLLAGIPRASAVALVATDEAVRGPQPQPKGAGRGHGPAPPVRVLHWDRRLVGGDDFRPSQRLILDAIRRGESELHIWEPNREATASQFTVSANVDWAFCTPVRGDACRGWGVYVAGQFTASLFSDRPTAPEDLREDMKFTELVAATLNSLRQTELLQRKQAALRNFFSPQIMEALTHEDPEVVLAPRETDVSVLFCDVRGFSRRAEQAGNLLALLDRVSKALGVMTHHILDKDGVFGDFQGDAAMGFWGWPIAQDDAVGRACSAALAIRLAFETAARQPEHPLADFHVGIGLATGRAVAGRIGTVDQSKVTVFGPVVNLASRLEGMTKFLNTPILLDEPTARAVREQVPHEVARLRRIAVVRPYGCERPVEVSELLPPADVYPDLTDENIRDYEAALDAFIAGDWSTAVQLLRRLPAQDRVQDFLTVYIAQYNRTPPSGWDGVVTLERKG
ncbi:MAG TPA: adenylate/guanylate cyclase domain-containing protein [Pirellulales bacterium]|nr:adenylate/guanylate cyclase domain-containing protein [Pirellulales bacterium]